MAHSLKQNRGQDCAPEHVCLGLPQCVSAAFFVPCPTVLPCPALLHPASQAGLQQSQAILSLSPCERMGGEKRECREAHVVGEEQASWIFSSLNLGLCVSLRFKQRHFPCSNSELVSLGNPGCRPSGCEWEALSSVRCKSGNRAISLIRLDCLRPKCSQALIS